MCGVALTFDSTNHRALDKVFLDERIYADDRHSGEDDAGSFQNFGIRHSNGGNTLGLETFTRGNNQVIQFELQRVIYALSDFLIMILSWLVKQSLRAFLFQEVQL